MGFFGKEKELLPKDVLVDLEKNPNRADEMLEKIMKMDSPVPWDGNTFVTATAVAFPGPSDLERALQQMNQFNDRQFQLQQMQQMANLQNQGLQGGLNAAGIGNALGGLGGLLGPRS